MELNAGLPLLPREQPSNIFSGHPEIWTGGDHGSFKAAAPLPMASLAPEKKRKNNYIVTYSVFTKRTQS
jgi:hypothetical protein